MGLGEGLFLLKNNVLSILGARFCTLKISYICKRQTKSWQSLRAMKEIPVKESRTLRCFIDI
jgi:hypothetical protein